MTIGTSTKKFITTVRLDSYTLVQTSPFQSMSSIRDRFRNRNRNSGREVYTYRSALTTE